MIGLKQPGFQHIANRPAVRFGNLSREARIDAHLAKADAPAFRQAIADTYRKAQDYIAQQLSRNQSGIVVLDIDETVLDNREFFRDPNRQYYKKGPGSMLKQGWDQWVQSMAIPVIPAAKNFIDWLNQKQVPYCFITGIKDDVQAFSFQNLQNQGVVGPACLGAFYRPVNWKQTVQDFKIQQRQQLEALHKLPILASIGDRVQDMTGQPDKDFLLPGYIEALRKENDRN